MPADKKADQVSPNLSAHTIKYLKRLTKTGVHGKTITTVARTLIQDQIKLLIVQGALRWEFDDGDGDGASEEE